MTEPDNWSHIEVTAGTVTEAYMEGAYGRRPLPELAGQFKFFIYVVERDGGRLDLNSCSGYEEAIRLAEEARVDFEIDEPVHDCVLGGVE